MRGGCYLEAERRGSEYIERIFCVFGMTNKEALEIVVESAGWCSCKPSSKEVERILRGITPPCCMHCGQAMSPKKVSLMCFCQAPAPGSPWAWGIDEVAESVNVEVMGQIRLLHKKCFLKAFPSFT